MVKSRIRCAATAAMVCSTWAATAPGAPVPGNAKAPGEIRLEPNGTVLISPPGYPPVSIAFFLWHDKWVYERLERGKVLEALTTSERGVKRLAGLWGTREGVPPLRYELRLLPEADGMKLELKTAKTGPLKLSNGLWCHIQIPTQTQDERRLVYAAPRAHAPLGKPLAGAFRSLLVGEKGGAAFVVRGDGIRTMRSRVVSAAHNIEMCLRPTDFAEGEEVTTNLHIGFGTMPEEFPGQIEATRAPLRIASVAGWPQSVGLFGLVQCTVALDAAWDNPFDPDDVALDAHVTTASGATYVQPGFYMIPHERTVEGDGEIMMPSGKGRWCVRLAATELGPLRCELRARDRSGSVRYSLPPVAVTASESKGFIRVSSVDPHFFRHDSGAGFIPIGHNLPIYHATGQLMDAALAKMAANGENYNRWWMSASGLGLEWEPKLGWYRQAEAARLDFVLDLAARLDMVYMLCMDTHQDFRQQGWKQNPFNAANGGPCQTVEEWFTNSEAKSLYRKRLRYTVARWGYCPNVLCWEFGNEFEGWEKCKREVVIEWHREMSAALAQLDPYRHLITTSWWSKTGPETCWEIPHLDIVQTHCYTNNDANVAEQVRDYCLHQWRTFRKPHVFGEFGIRSHDTTADKDPKGWALHNSAWASICSGCNGNPMPWWHENYIEPLNLYFHFQSIRNFTRDLPFGQTTWRQVEVSSVEYVAPPERPIVRDAVLATTSGFRRREVNEFTLSPDGSVNDAKSLLELLHGQAHRDLRNPPVFQVNYPAAGAFSLHVGTVSKSGLLRVFVDGVQALEKAFPCGEGKGRSWQHRPQWQLWESDYNETVSVPIPAGAHTVRVENLGGDWMRVKEYRFEGCKVVERPDLLCAALATDDVAIVWLQNRGSTWHNHGAGAVEPVPASVVTLSGFEEGFYAVEWWETWQGKVSSRERLESRDGRLVLRLGEIVSDVAAKIRRAR